MLEPTEANMVNRIALAALAFAPLAGCSSADATSPAAITATLQAHCGITK